MIFNRSLPAFIALAFSSMIIGGCSTGDANDIEPIRSHDFSEYALSDYPFTTLQGSLALNPGTLGNSPAGTEDNKAPSAPTDLEPILQAGMPWIENSELAEEFEPGLSHTRRSLAYFWVVADPQLVDEESPANRATSQPHYHLTTQLLEAQVRTARRISDSSSRPFDFAVLPGDLTENAQKNEIEWLLTIMNGGVVDPDTGRDNDPVIGDGNDYNDPFMSRGINVPWYSALGNHDLLFSGRLATYADKHIAQAGYLEDGRGYRDGSTVNAVLRVSGSTEPDIAREVLSVEEMADILTWVPNPVANYGHNDFDASQRRTWFWTHPIPNKPLRLVVINTVDLPPNARPGFPFGITTMMSRRQFSWLKETLEQAEAEGDLVIIMGHHESQHFDARSEVSSQEYMDLVASHPNVILQLSGHGHKNSAKLIKGSPEYTDDSGANVHRGYWDLMTASTRDYPFRSRIIEIVYEGNDYISVYVTSVEPNVKADSLAYEAMQLGNVEKADKSPAPFDASADNLLLRVQIPANLSSRLNQVEWPSAIESEVTLNTFQPR